MKDTERPNNDSSSVALVGGPILHILCIVYIVQDETSNCPGRVTCTK